MIRIKAKQLPSNVPPHAIEDLAKEAVNGVFSKMLTANSGWSLVAISDAKEIYMCTVLVSPCRKNIFWVTN